MDRIAELGIQTAFCGENMVKSSENLGWWGTVPGGTGSSRSGRYCSVIMNPISFPTKGACLSEEREDRDNHSG